MFQMKWISLESEDLKEKKQHLDSEIIENEAKENWSLFFMCGAIYNFLY